MCRCGDFHLINKEFENAMNNFFAQSIKISTIPVCTLLPINHDLGSSENFKTSQISVPVPQQLTRYRLGEPAERLRNGSDHASLQ